MPSYVYHCAECNKEFEVFHSITAEPLSACPTCQEAGKPDVAPQRLISATSFILTGGGWASSGYSSK